MKDDPHGSRARARQFQAARMMPNRLEKPLDDVEHMAEAADGDRTREAARETGNWPLVGALDALTKEVTRRQRQDQAGDAVVLGRPAFNR